MLTKIITIKFDSLMECFDDASLKEFIKGKEVLSIREHFFIKDEKPYIAAVIIYKLNSVVFPSDSKDISSKKDDSWRELIGESDVPLFNSLRDYRSERCKKDGVPPYIICTNRQLAQIVKNRPQSLNSLMEIEGLGKAKSEKYGQEILEILKAGRGNG